MAEDTKCIDCGKPWGGRRAHLKGEVLREAGAHVLSTPTTPRRIVFCCDKCWRKYKPTKAQGHERLRAALDELVKKL